MQKLDSFPFGVETAVVVDFPSFIQFVEKELNLSNVSGGVRVGWEDHPGQNAIFESHISDDLSEQEYNGYEEWSTGSVEGFNSEDDYIQSIFDKWYSEAKRIQSIKPDDPEWPKFHRDNAIDIMILFWYFCKKGDIPNIGPVKIHVWW